jgi:hypothetical protein
VSIASRAQHLGVDPAAVVAHEDAKVRPGRLDSDLDAGGSRVAERVDERFASDAVDVVADHRVQGPGLAFTDDSKRDLILDSQLLTDPGEGQQRESHWPAANVWRTPSG